MVKHKHVCNIKSRLNCAMPPLITRPACVCLRVIAGRNASCTHRLRCFISDISAAINQSARIQQIRGAILYVGSVETGVFFQRLYWVHSPKISQEPFGSWWCEMCYRRDAPLVTKKGIQISNSLLLTLLLLLKPINFRIPMLFSYLYIM